jgi:uncharacterized membrane protein YuzA (DUF378 family)
MIILIQVAIVLALIFGVVSPLTALIAYILCGVAAIVGMLYVIACDLAGIELNSKE